MKKTEQFLIMAGLLLVLSILNTGNLSACSTFKLQKGDKLIYGHNLNEGDIGVPGMIFINKRNIFKNGRSWSEMINKDRSNQSTFSWISRYGSVSFNGFGKDFPDGGMNESGLFIWEMNEAADYPQNDSLPKLMHMNWMQYVLDNTSTLDEAIESASLFQIDGWTWHYFIGDKDGNCAALAFIDGKIKVTRDKTMPVPGLYNTPYDRELELLKYFKGFGGSYEINMDDPEIPRIAKTAKLIQEYDPAQNAVEYGFKMLDKIKVNDEPEWSVIFDVRQQNVYFKTRLNPAIKNFRMKDIDFSNNSPVQIVNIDLKEGGDITRFFHAYSNEEVKNFLEKSLIPIFPEKFFTAGGLSPEEFALRFSTHCDSASIPENQYFRGIWKTKPDPENKNFVITINMESNNEAVSCEISFKADLSDTKKCDHLQLLGNKLAFTFRSKEKKTIFELQGTLDKDVMTAHLFGIEDYYGRFLFYRQN